MRTMYGFLHGPRPIPDSRATGRGVRGELHQAQLGEGADGRALQADDGILTVVPGGDCLLDGREGRGLAHESQMKTEIREEVTRKGSGVLGLSSLTCGLVHWCRYLHWCRWAGSVLDRM